jgi:hypothetical protein
MKSDSNDETDRLYVLAHALLTLMTTSGQEGFELGRRWSWRLRLRRMGGISLAGSERARSRRDQAVSDFTKELYACIEAEVASAAEAHLGGREGGEVGGNPGRGDRARGAFPPPSGGAPRRRRPSSLTHPTARSGPIVQRGNDFRSRDAAREIEVHIRVRRLAHWIQYLLRRAGERGYANGRSWWWQGRFWRKGYLNYPRDPAQVEEEHAGGIAGSTTIAKALHAIIRAEVEDAFAASLPPKPSVPEQYLEGERAQRGSGGDGDGHR